MKNPFSSKDLSESVRRRVELSIALAQERLLSTHVAHDCRIGNEVIMANAATLAGHVEIADRGGEVTEPLELRLPRLPDVRRERGPTPAARRRPAPRPRRRRRWNAWWRRERRWRAR